MANKKTDTMASQRDGKQAKQATRPCIPAITMVALLAMGLGGILSGKQADYWLARRDSGPVRLQRDLDLGAPDRLLNYGQFRGLYPLIEAASGVEDLHRKLMFNSELVWICQVNLATLSGLQLYYLQQSPFAFGDQLSDGCSMADHRLHVSSGSDIIDFMTGTVNKDGAKLHRDLPITRPLVRALVSDKRYEVPNKPLEAQPDATKITHIDVDHRNCSGPVPDQGQCGSCYAFAFNAYIEWQYCQQSADKRPVKFSDQYILDCGPDFSSNLRGCSSGVLSDVRSFHHHNGFFMDQDYPYEAKSNWCKHKIYNSRNKRLLPNHKLFVAHAVHELTNDNINRTHWEQILQTKPILVGVDLPGDYSFYSRGIHHGRNCASKAKGHAMVLIGMGRENGHPYWLLKNSQGPRWGENGYMRLSRRAPMKKCFSEGVVIDHSFLDNEEAQFQAEVEDDIGPDDVAWLQGDSEPEPLRDPDAARANTYEVRQMDSEDQYDEFGNKKIRQ